VQCMALAIAASLDKSLGMPIFERVQLSAIFCSAAPTHSHNFHDYIYPFMILTPGFGGPKSPFMLWGNAARGSRLGPTNKPSFSQGWNITDELDRRDWTVELNLANSIEDMLNDFPLLLNSSRFREADRDRLMLRWGRLMEREA